MPETQSTEMKELHSLAEIPHFQTEDEEAEFWATHCLGDALLMQMNLLQEGILSFPGDDLYAEH